MTLQCTMIEPVGKYKEYVVLWDGDGCPGRLHSARLNVGPCAIDDREPPPLADMPEWEGACERCGEAIPWRTAVKTPHGCGDPTCMTSSLKRSAGTRVTWSTPSGKPEPGSMFWQYWNVGENHHCSGNWDGCQGPHLIAVCPNGSEWDIDSRAANCTMKDERTHRCWIRSGEPPMVTAGKAGHTCTAGAGSIQAGDYHGFLQNGSFT